MAYFKYMRSPMYQFIGLLLLLASVFYLKDYLASFRQIHESIPAALDKKKSFDLKDHSFTFNLTLQVKEKDAFLFHDSLNDIKIEVYKAVLYSKANMDKDSIDSLTGQIDSMLAERHIRHRLVNIQMISN